MKQWTKNLLKVVISCLIILVGIIVIPKQVKAEETYGDLTYVENDDGTIEITDCSNSATSVVVPEKINGKSVTSIEDDAFCNCSSLKSIYIPAEIKINIDDYFGIYFRECSSLEQIEVSTDSKYYSSYDGCLYNKDKSILLRCPEGKKSVNIYSDTKQIGDRSFYNCTLITKIDLMNTQYCGWGSFFECTKLAEITISDDFEGFEYNTFDYCNSLEVIKIPTNSQKYFIENEILYNKSKTKIILASKKQAQVTITIPDTVKEIGPGAFSYATINKVIIPKTVSKIGDWAFYGGKINNITFLGDCSQIGGLALMQVEGKICIYSSPMWASYFRYYNGFIYHSEQFGSTGGEMDAYIISGIFPCENNIYKYFKNGEIDSTYSGIVSYGSDKWSVKNGIATKLIDVSKLAISLSSNSCVYTGSSIKPSVKVTYNGKTLVNGTDYSVSYSNNIKPGTAKVTITAKGKYNGSITKTFTISLGKPSLSNPSNSSNGVQVKWNKINGASGYYIYRKTGSGSWAKIATISSGSTVTYTDKTAVAGTTYVYTVKAYNGSYTSSYDTTGKTLKRISQPTLSSITNGSSGLTIKWNKTSGASGYYVYRKTGSGSWTKIATIKSASTVSYLDKTAKAGTTYTYTVRAYSGSYISSYNTSGKSLKRLTQPVPTVANASSGVTVKWGKVTGATGYYVYRKTGSGSWAKIATIKSGSTISYLDKTAKAGTTYSYTVRAYNGSYISSYLSAGKSIRRLTQPTVSVPKVSTGINVKWTKATGATGYYVYRKTAGKSWSRIATIKSGKTVSYVDKTAKKGTTYYYTVRAYYGSYTSSYNTSGKAIKR